MRPSALVSLLVVLCTSFVQIQSELVRGGGRGRGRGAQQQKRRAQERTTFQSFFNVIYLGNENGEADLMTAAETLAFAYNGNFLPRYSNDEAYVQVEYTDPFDRRMELVEVVEVESRRVLSEEEIRSLQSSQLRNLNVFLRVTGSCSGCPSRTRFTNQVSSRRRRRVKSKSGKGKGGVEPVPVQPVPVVPSPIIPPPIVDGRDDTITSPVPIATPAPTPPPTVPYVDPADLPTEAELLSVYAMEIRKKNLNILDVLSLDEIDN